MATDAPALSLRFDPNSLPLGQLESLRFKAVQIIESIQTLQRTLDGSLGGNPNVMPAWPDILTKYNILLSQTHSFSQSLLTVPHSSYSSQSSSTHSAFERIALHPYVPLPDTLLDNSLTPLLRNQQTTDVLRMESNTVRRIAEKMLPSLSGPAGPATHEVTISAMSAVRAAHDSRVERAVRAVTMLRERYEWRQRVEVEIEEPDDVVEEETPTPTFTQAQAPTPNLQTPTPTQNHVLSHSFDHDGDNDGDEEEVESELVDRIDGDGDSSEHLLAGGDIEMT
ncbi:hypothetical protein SERLADRAFT_478348 [Serpula lacrymans var. lacrymans S7.9]|uniref:Mediator complex subunit 8 n=1 Tax=Serpula lacrymans var. lacrymans (strain S7.9) TaxID=578457 RepID=F8PAQ3_SERL9|nr:uncharacterized protein SERLADRAFT_478348 [Serpula lacrymans var. lacrymans S7.9]EGO19891.1 hypothetical protein SERLADRAFT_478348 [Serpula lacrymans var. lacrymans S7.9]